MTLYKQTQSASNHHEVQLSEGVVLQPVNSMFSFRDLVAMIYRRRWLALALFAAILTVVALVTMTQPPIYQARAKLLFKKERANTVISTSESANAEAVKPQVSEEVLNSEIEIIQSTILLREVLRKNNLYRQIIGVRVAGELDSATALELAIARLKRDMNCQIVPKSNILQISYESEEPHLTAEIVNDLCQQYVIRHLEVHESPGIYSFFQKQSEVLYDTLQAMAAVLQHFEAESGLIAPEQQRQLFLQKLTDYETQLNATRTNAQVMARQVEFLERQIAATPSQLQAQNRQVSSAVIEALAKELESLKLQYEPMVRKEKNRSEPKGQLARNLKARIAQIEETIQQQNRAEPPEISTDINRTMMELSAQLTRARFDLIGYQEKEKELTAAMAQLKQDLKNLERDSFKHEEMVRQLQLVQHNYMLYAKRQEEARISKALDREKVANVSIIDPASVPLVAVRPNRKLNLAMGFFLAVFVSLGTALGLGLFDGVIHSDVDIERQLRVPVIVSIPEGQGPPKLLPENEFALES